MLRNWDSLEIVDVSLPNSTISPLDLGETLRSEVILNLGEVNPDDIMVELVRSKSK